MSSIKKNALAAALVAGLGLAGTAAAYNYGTLLDVNAPRIGDANTAAVAVDLPRPERVAFQNILTSGPTEYRYTMREQLIWDIDPPDNAVNFTQGFTARMTLEDGALFDTSYTPTVFNVDPATCVDPDGVGPAPAASATVRTTEDIYLDGTLACTWDVSFDAYYNGGQTISIRITPKQGVTNPQNPSTGLLLRYDNARLASLDEFVSGPVGTLVNGTFWLVNPSNDAIFVDSRQRRAILEKVSGVTACADQGASGELNKFIDVADNWTENQKPKTRFSFDGRLGSANDASGGSTIFDAEDYDSQVIDLGYVTLGTNDTVGGFAFQAADAFRTTLTGDNGGWLAFENGPGLFNDDLWLVNGTCSSGLVIARGEIIGNTVRFDYTGATLAGVFGPAATQEGFAGNMTVCGFVNTDTLINDQNISVATDFTRANVFGGTQSFAGAACTLLPLRYNGSTMEIFTINPADNDRQRSFIRLTNRSATAGWVRLEGIDDNGVAAPGGQVSVELQPGQSVQLTAAELENGGFAGQNGAWGNGTGKWRAVVTAEFPGLVASSYVRNTIGDILSNITDADTRGEQYTNDYAEGTFASTPGERPSDFSQETTPDFRGNGRKDGIPGGPNGSDGPAGGTTAECGNPGISPGTPVPNCPSTQVMN